MINLKDRAEKCITENLCFVSLQAIKKDNSTFLDHSVAGSVLVNNDFIKTTV